MNSSHSATLYLNKHVKYLCEAHLKSKGFSFLMPLLPPQGTDSARHFFPSSCFYLPAANSSSDGGHRAVDFRCDYVAQGGSNISLGES